MTPAHLAAAGTTLCARRADVYQERINFMAHLIFTILYCFTVFHRFRGAVIYVNGFKGLKNGLHPYWRNLIQIRNGEIGCRKILLDLIDYLSPFWWIMMIAPGIGLGQALWILAAVIWIPILVCEVEILHVRIQESLAVR
ncbi:MAG: hypothetical protein KBC15_04015 [Candidatus Levybacteria bacterium]|nr:hypothetical protein [Candidatus Levybacteria bacterium]